MSKELSIRSIYGQKLAPIDDRRCRMSAEFRYRVDATRELVLTSDDPHWFVCDQGLEPKIWDVATHRERAMLAEIVRLRQLFGGDQ